MLVTYHYTNPCNSFEDRVPHLQMSCKDLTTWQGTRIFAWFYGISNYNMPHSKVHTWSENLDGDERLLDMLLITWTNEYFENKICLCIAYSSGRLTHCNTLMPKQNDHHEILTCICFQLRSSYFDYMWGTRKVISPMAARRNIPSFSMIWNDISLFTPLRAKFFRVIQNLYLHFMSYLHIDMTQVVEILPREWAGLAYFT